MVDIIIVAPKDICTGGDMITDFTWTGSIIIEVTTTITNTMSGISIGKETTEADATDSTMHQTLSC